MYEVAVPSAGRADRIGKLTMPMLLAGGVPEDRITVFVPDHDAFYQYRRVLPPAVRLLYGHGWGVREARNAIARHYPFGTRVLEVDDDMTGLYAAVDPKTLEPVRDVHGLIEAGFAEAGDRLWGLYPVANPFFMKPGRIRRGLYFIEGNWFGFKVTGHDVEIGLVDEKDDYERAIRYYLRDGEVVRYDGITYRSRYLREPGGMQTYRTPASVLAGAHAIVERYPELSTLRTSKNGRVEIRLKDRRTV